MTARRTVRPLGRNHAQLLKYMMQDQIERMAHACMGEITSLDLKNYRAKVNLVPVGGETGFIPICTLYAGNGYGITAIPPIGAQVIVIFEGADLNLGRIIGFTYNQVDKAPQLKQGQLAISNESGAKILLDADGSISMNGGKQPVARFGDEVTVTVNGTAYTGTITSGASAVKA